jgi:hypothetical protein
MPAFRVRPTRPIFDRSRHGIGAFIRFSVENATMHQAKMLERFLSPVDVKPLWTSTPPARHVGNPP